MKKISWLAIVVFLMALLVFYYVNRPTQSVAAQDPELEVNLTQLFDELETDYEQALTKYDQKVILIQGSYYSLSGDKQPILILEDENGRMANCNLETSHEGTLQKGAQVSIKGVFVGYEELLGEVQLNKCHIE